MTKFLENQEADAAEKPAEARTAFPREVKKALPLYCSFCGKNNDEVAYLVAGPTVFICNECVELAREVGQNLLTKNGTVNPPAPTDGHA